MAKTKSMTRNQNDDDDDDASIRKRIKIDDNCGLRPWSDVNHDVLLLVMMNLGVIDFLSFSGVCKSWRSLALSKRTMFMATKPPMFIRISPRAHKDVCYLIDFEGIKLKTSDFWLVNPITRHELHFPCHPSFQVSADTTSVRSVLVFSPSISGWVFVTSHRFTNEIWFSVAGKGAWNHVYSTFPILDLHAFKGKIYTLNTCFDIHEVRHICEMSLNPEPKLTILETKNFPNSCLAQEFVSSGENLFVVQSISEQECVIHELDVDEMKWVSHEKKNEEYAFFLSRFKSSAAVKPLSWADPSSGRFAETLSSGKVRLFRENMWYFPHDCFNVNSLEV